MTKYLFSRLGRGIISIVLVVMIVMLLIYSLMDKEQIFATDPIFSKQKSNNKIVYKYQQWEKYGYLDYVPYSEWLQQQLNDGEIAEDKYSAAVNLGKTEQADNAEAAKYAAKFTEYYESKGYKVERLKGDTQGAKYKEGGNPRLFAYKNTPILNRVWDYFTGVITFDNIHHVEDDAVGERGLEFTFFDPAYGGEKFSPAIMGNGTEHKYLLYFDDQFPFVHQNFVKIRLGTSYSVNQGIDVFDTMTNSQGSQKHSMVTYPSGLQEMSADNLHSATYAAGSLTGGNVVIADRYRRLPRRFAPRNDIRFLIAYRTSKNYNL